VIELFYSDGSATFLKYGFTVTHPSVKTFFASSLLRAGTIITSSPFFQSAVLPLYASK